MFVEKVTKMCTQTNHNSSIFSRDTLGMHKVRVWHRNFVACDLRKSCESFRNALRICGLVLKNWLTASSMEFTDLRHWPSTSMPTGGWKWRRKTLELPKASLRTFKICGRSGTIEILSSFRKLSLRPRIQLSLTGLGIGFVYLYVVQSHRQAATSSWPHSNQRLHGARWPCCLIPHWKQVEPRETSKSTAMPMSGTTLKNGFMATGSPKRHFPITAL